MSFGILCALNDVVASFSFINFSINFVANAAEFESEIHVLGCHVQGQHGTYQLCCE